MILAATLAIAPGVSAQETIGLRTAASAGVGSDGFDLHYLQLGIDARFADHFVLDGLVRGTVDEVTLESAYVGVDRLPLDTAVRVGLIRSWFGLENQRYATERPLGHLPLALQKFFGPFGLEAVGADVHLVVPLLDSWDLGFFAAMTRGGGRGQRSALGAVDRDIETLADFSYQLGFENTWTAGDVQIGFDLHVIFAPNDSGRRNATDVYGTTAWVGWRPDPDGLGLAFETEWMLRRRQTIASALQDLGGWAQFTVWFDDHWSIAGRYDFTEGLTGDPLDPTDDENRHRGELQVAWDIVDQIQLSLAGWGDVGGPHEDPEIGVMLYMEAGWSTRLLGDEEGAE